MVGQIAELNPCDYGLVTERSEGGLYLMQRCKNRPGWAEEVAVRLDGGWIPASGSKYLVLVGDVTWAKKGDKSRLLKILGELNNA